MVTSGNVANLLAAVCFGVCLAMVAAVEGLAPAQRAAFACKLSILRRPSFAVDVQTFPFCVGGPADNDRTHAPRDLKLEGRVVAAKGAAGGRPFALCRSAEPRAVVSSVWRALRAAASLRMAASRAAASHGGLLFFFIIFLFAHIKGKLPEAPVLGPNFRQGSPAPTPEPLRALCLDVDSTCIYGDDGNDLAIGFQHCHKSMEDITRLYERLFNPKVAELVESMRAQGIADEMRVCLYTRRATLLRFRSSRTCVESRMTYGDWQHTPDQVAIPGRVATSDEIMQACHAGELLSEEDADDLRASWDRLLAVRNAVQRRLKLEYMPEIVVTAASKNVRGTAALLGLDPERAVLWDDNTQLVGDPNVEVVERFDSMEPGQREELLQFLKDTNPAHTLPQHTVNFMLSTPNPNACALEYVDSALAYRISISEEASAARAFAVPDFFLAPSSSSSSSPASSPTPVGAGLDCASA